MGRYTGILGLLAMLGLAYAFSNNRRAIRLKTVAWGLGLQIVFAIFCRGGPPGPLGLASRCAPIHPRPARATLRGGGNRAPEMAPDATDSVQRQDHQIRLR